MLFCVTPSNISFFASLSVNQPFLFTLSKIGFFASLLLKSVRLLHSLQYQLFCFTLSNINPFASLSPTSVCLFHSLDDQLFFFTPSNIKSSASLPPTSNLYRQSLQHQCFWFTLWGIGYFSSRSPRSILLLHSLQHQLVCFTPCNISSFASLPQTSARLLHSLQDKLFPFTLSNVSPFASLSQTSARLLHSLQYQFICFTPSNNSSVAYLLGQQEPKDYRMCPHYLQKVRDIVSEGTENVEIAIQTGNGFYLSKAYDIAGHVYEEILRTNRDDMKYDKILCRLIQADIKSKNLVLAEQHFENCRQSYNLLMEHRQHVELLYINALVRNNNYRRPWNVYPCVCIQYSPILYGKFFLLKIHLRFSKRSCQRAGIAATNLCEIFPIKRDSTVAHLWERSVPAFDIATEWPSASVLENSNLGQRGRNIFPWGFII
jgi:hypothetical protein